MSRTFSKDLFNLMKGRRKSIKAYYINFLNEAKVSHFFKIVRTFQFEENDIFTVTDEQFLFGEDPLEHFCTYRYGSKSRYQHLRKCLRKENSSLSTNKMYDLYLNINHPRIDVSNLCYEIERLNYHISQLNIKQEDEYNLKNVLFQILAYDNYDTKKANYLDAWINETIAILSKYNLIIEMIRAGGACYSKPKKMFKFFHNLTICDLRTRVYKLSEIKFTKQ